MRCAAAKVPINDLSIAHQQEPRRGEYGQLLHLMELDRFVWDGQGPLSPIGIERHLHPRRTRAALAMNKDEEVTFVVLDPRLLQLIFQQKERGRCALGGWLRFYFFRGVWRGLLL